MLWGMGKFFSKAVWPAASIAHEDSTVSLLRLQRNAQAHTCEKGGRAQHVCGCLFLLLAALLYTTG